MEIVAINKVFVIDNTIFVAIYIEKSLILQGFFPR